jgi:hypothetical protein
LRAVPNTGTDLKNNIGYEDWRWNIDVVNNGGIHKIVPNTAYFTPSWTAISRQAGQAFHAKVGTDFTASWTAISREAGQ